MADSESLRLLKSFAKRWVDVAFGMKVMGLRALGAVDFPVPPNHNMRKTSSHTVRHYYESGLTTVLPIAVSAMHEGFDLDCELDVLDFGCGAGRQLLQMTRLFPRLTLSGCDVDSDCIQSVQKLYPQVDAYTNAFDPPLRYGDSSFDIIYSVSIFSHLAPGDRDLWLYELARVLRPGGIALLTFNGLRSLRRSHSRGVHLQHSEDDLDRKGFIFESADTDTEISRRTSRPVFGESLTGVPRKYGNIYHHPKSLQRYFEIGDLELRGHLSGIIDQIQDLIVLKKPASQQRK